MSEPRTLGSVALVRLVAAREMSARLRDKNFLISSAVILVLCWSRGIDLRPADARE